MTAETHRRHERIRRLLAALYREDLRAATYRVFRRRAGDGPAGTMIGTALRVEERMIGLLEGHLEARGAGRSVRGAPLRRLLRGLGTALGYGTGLGRTSALLRRFRVEERRAAERYGRELDWIGWSRSERETMDGHRCDLLYQDQWVEELQRDRKLGTEGRSGHGNTRAGS